MVQWVEDLPLAQVMIPGLLEFLLNGEPAFLSLSLSPLPVLDKLKKKKPQNNYLVSSKHPQIIHHVYVHVFQVLKSAPLCPCSECDSLTQAFCDQ